VPASISILVAEDDPAIARGYQIILQESGYNVVGIANNGEEAISLSSALQPDLILMDIKMPKLNGLDAARMINENRQGSFIPIVLVTAYAESSLIQKAKHCGVLGYLVKPVHLDDLVPAVELAYSAGQKINALEGVVDNLSEELEARKLIERAKGLVMKHLKLPEDEAMRLLQRESRRQRIKLKELAKSIIASHAALS